MSEMINNLKEFLHWRGFGEDEARYWARCFYKYTDCGPWAVFMMEGDTEIYYEDIGRKKDDGTVISVDPDKCIGIKFGSIVEGSDCYSGPFEHVFPFKTEDFERDEQFMEDETSFYWERDNSQWYEVVVNGKNEYYLHDTWGEIKWDSKPPSRTLRKKIEEFVQEHHDDIPSEPHFWQTPKPEWEPIRIPGTRAVICERINDTVFD